MSRFSVWFYNADAVKEYRRLDGSIKRLVDIGLKKLEDRADEIGKTLQGELRGCKELIYRDHGIRIVFRVVNDEVEIVEIIAIGPRDKGKVFASAALRLRNERDPRK